MMDRLLSLSPIGIAIIDFAGNYVEFNAAYSNLYAYDAAALKSEQFTVVFSPDKRAGVLERHQKFLTDGDPLGGEWDVVRHDGVRLVIKSESVRVTSEAGEPLRLVYVIDITQRRRAELALAHSEKRLSTVISTAMDAVVCLDQTRRISVFNPAAERMFGYPAEQMLGQPLDLLLPDEARHAHPQHIDAFALSGATTRRMGRLGQLQARRSTGDLFPIEASIAHGGSQDDTIFTVIIRDITEQQKAAAALQQSLHEKEALIKEVHHRVKNNLQLVTSLLRLESSRTEVDEVHSVLLNMRNRIRSMSMLHELLYQTGTLAFVDLQNYIRQLATQTFQSLLPPDRHIALKVDLASLQVGMDQAVPCGLLVSELLINCLKHGFPENRHGEVLIGLQPATPSDQWLLSVRDTGIGLPPDFETKRNDSLGMQLVQDLAQQMGGTLAIQSQPGAGAEFSVTFKVEDASTVTIHPVAVPHK